MVSFPTVSPSRHEELNNLYSSPNFVRVIKSRRMRWAGHVARMGEERGVYRVFVGKPEGRRPLGRPRRRWVYNMGEEKWGNRVLVGKPEGKRTLGRHKRRWVDNIGEERGCIGSWWGNRREGDHWGDLGVDGWIKWARKRGV